MAKKAVAKKAKPTKVAKKVRKVEVEEPETPTLEESAFNPYAQYNSVLDEVAKKLSDADTLEDITPMSTGSLTLDMILGGGIRPAWYTNFGPEQSAKTTGALLVMASAIKQNVPIIALRDFEGCVTRDTLISCNGVSRRLDEIFDLTGLEDAEPGHWYNQFAEVDTLAEEGTRIRVGRLYYKGIVDTTEITLANGTKLRGNGHTMFVLDGDRVIEKKMEDLSPGDLVFTQKKRE